ncbi:MAG: hypothetical protein ACT4QE_05750 [Anaerolineales bacterium]
MRYPQDYAEVMSIWRWYGRQFKVEPQSGMNPEGGCIRLTTTDHALIRLTTEVMLCSVTHSTRVYFNQTVYLRP